MALKTPGIAIKFDHKHTACRKHNSKATFLPPSCSEVVRMHCEVAFHVEVRSIVVCCFLQRNPLCMHSVFNNK